MRLQACAKRTDSDSSCACVKYYPGLWSPFIHSVVSNDSVSGQWRLWSDCADAQADLGLRCTHIPEDTFRLAGPILQPIFIPSIQLIDVYGNFLHGTRICFLLLFFFNSTYWLISSILAVGWYLFLAFSLLAYIANLFTGQVFVTCSQPTGLN